MSFVFDMQTFADSDTTTTDTTLISSSDTTEQPTIIVLSDKTLVDKEHAEYYVRKTIKYVQKHAFDGVKLVTNKDVDDFFDMLEAEAAATLSGGDDDNDTVPSGAGDSDTSTGGINDDTPEGGEP